MEITVTQKSKKMLHRPKKYRTEKEISRHTIEDRTLTMQPIKPIGLGPSPGPATVTWPITDCSQSGREKRAYGYPSKNIYN